MHPGPLNFRFSPVVLRPAPVALTVAPEVAEVVATHSRRKPRLGTFVVSLSIATLLAATACSRSAPPATRPTPPAPVPPMPESVPAARFTLPTTIAQTVYDVRVTTEISLDNAGVFTRDTVENTARVSLSLRRDVRGFLRGPGRVDSFTVRGSNASPRVTTERPVRAPGVRMSSGQAQPTTPGQQPQFTTVAIDAVLDSSFTRAVVRPPLGNECDRQDALKAAAAAVARDLLVRVPATLDVGDRWRDSVVTFVCNGGVPMTMRTIIESEATGTRDGNRSLLVHRALSMRLDGNDRTPWTQVTIDADGAGVQDAVIDIATGAMVELTGRSTLTVRVTSGSQRDAPRTQQVVQRVTTTAKAIR